MNKNILDIIQSKLNTTLTFSSVPKPGMGSEVLFAKDPSGREYAIKIGDDARNDVLAITLIEKNQIYVPVPRIYLEFAHDNSHVVIMNRFSDPLLDDLPKESYKNFLPSIINNLKQIHSVKTETAGLLAEENQNSWKELLLHRLSGSHPWFPWKEIKKREHLDEEIISSALKELNTQLRTLDFPEKDYSLLHTDINQKNIIVNPKTKKVTGIIDWSESMFGDPLYDFARTRLFIIHHDLGKSVMRSFEQGLNLSPNQESRLMLYFYMIVLEYLNWYTEEIDEFNLGRIKLHQQLLNEWVG